MSEQVVGGKGRADASSRGQASVWASHVVDGRGFDQGIRRRISRRRRTQRSLHGRNLAMIKPLKQRVPVE